MRVAARVPFAERGGKIRGLLDLATGRYPLFLFGGPIVDLLPVFHFHDVSASSLEPRLQYLAENGYRTVIADAIARLVRHRAHPGRRTVALCFDDARASLWTVAAPLLRRYGFRAITFAIPGRIEDAATTRRTEGDGAPPRERRGETESPFVTWPELRSLHASGIIDVQCHTYSHSRIFCADHLTGFVTPEYATSDLLDRPLITTSDGQSYLTPADLGAPLYLQRSRMSDGVRFIDDGGVRTRCVAHARAQGGSAFFAKPGWEAELRAIVAEGENRYETGEQQNAAIREELDKGRAVLAERLRASTIRHLCFPWGVAGALARDAARTLGYETAFSERLFGRRAVRAGDDPFRLMRLNGKLITLLPRRRRLFFLPRSEHDPGTPRDHA